MGWRMDRIGGEDSVWMDAGAAGVYTLPLRHGGLAACTGKEECRGCHEGRITASLSVSALTLQYSLTL